MIIGPKGQHGRGCLKSYSATSKMGQHTLTVTLEYEDASDLGWDVSSLDAIAAEDKAASQRRKKQLALPATER